MLAFVRPRRALPCAISRILALAALSACPQAPDASSPTAQAPAPAPREPEDTEAPAWTFQFKDPAPGPRAPVTAAIHAELGRTTFADARALTDRLGLQCGDTSIRARMEARRARARGEDAVSGASVRERKSKREANPQIRYSCPKTRSEQLGDRPRPPSEGRLLFVFDSEDHPLRHISYQRTTRDAAAAVADYRDAVAHYTAVYGPPTRTPTRQLPGPGPDGALDLPVATNFDTEWAYADLLVKVTLLRYADLVTVGERIEVPPGVRPDAPQLGRTPSAPSAPPAGPSAGDSPTAAPAPGAPTPPGPAP